LAANRAALGKNELRGDAAGPGAGKARWPLIVPQEPDYPNRSRYSAERRRLPRLAPLLPSRGVAPGAKAGNREGRKLRYASAQQPNSITPGAWRRYATSKVLPIRARQDSLQARRSAWAGDISV